MQSFFKNWKSKSVSTDSENLTGSEEETEVDQPEIKTNEVKSNENSGKNLHQLPNPLFQMTPEDKKELEYVLRENYLRDYYLTF